MKKLGNVIADNSIAAGCFIY